MITIRTSSLQARWFRLVAMVAPIALAVVAMTGCAAKTHSTTKASSDLIVKPAPQRTAALSLPSAFPGQPLENISLRSNELVRSSARVLLSSTDGSLSLIVGRSHANRLCAGAFSPASGESTVRCLLNAERPPVIAFIATTGRTRANAGALRKQNQAVAGVPDTGPSNPALRHGLGVRSSSVVGLADPSTARVVLALQNNSRKTLTLRRLPGLSWRTFSAGPYENMASDSAALEGLPSSLIAFDRSGRKLGEVDLSWGYPNCRPDLCSYRKTKTGNWVIVRDPIASQQSPEITTALERQATKLLFSNANVRRIVSGRQYSLDLLAYWQKCNGGTIGVMANVLLTQPVSITGTLPYTTYRNKTGSAYLEGRAFYDVGNVREITVGIDLNRKLVVSVDPTLGENVVVKDAHKVGTLHRGGGPDTTNCGSTGD